METLEVRQMRYLESHEVHEMFTNVVKALVVCQPSDPLRFIKWYLKGRRHVNVPKVILIGPPRRNTDRAYVALELAKNTGAVTVDRRNVLLRYRKKRGDELCPPDFAVALTEYMRAKGTRRKGWILLDVPNGRLEADRLISLGILPTHTIVFDDDNDDEDEAPNGEKTPIDEINRRYKNVECEIKFAFRSTLKEISIRGKTVDEIAESCLHIMRCKPTDPLVDINIGVWKQKPKMIETVIGGEEIPREKTEVHQSCAEL